MQSVPDSQSVEAQAEHASQAVYSTTGRIVRSAIGGGLIGFGVGRGGFAGVLISLVGIEPVLAGLVNFSLLGTILDLISDGARTFGGTTSGGSPATTATGTGTKHVETSIGT